MIGNQPAPKSRPSTTQLPRTAYPQRLRPGAENVIIGPSTPSPPDVRHQMPTILAVALCAVLAGARSFTAIGEWVATPRRGCWQPWAPAPGRRVSPVCAGHCRIWRATRGEGIPIDCFACLRRSWRTASPWCCPPGCISTVRSSAGASTRSTSVSRPTRDQPAACPAQDRPRHHARLQDGRHGGAFGPDSAWLAEHPVTRVLVDSVWDTLAELERAAHPPRLLARPTPPFPWHSRPLMSSARWPSGVMVMRQVCAGGFPAAFQLR